MYSRLMIFISAILLALALFFLPAGTAARLRRIGLLFVSPSEEISAMCTRVTREALGGLPPAMSIKDRDELLVKAASANAAMHSAEAIQVKLESENRMLHSLLRHVKVKRDYALVVAEVICQPKWRDAAMEIRVDRGIVDGVRQGQIALTTSGVAGVVTEVVARQSVVRLLGASEFEMICEIPHRQVSGIVRQVDGRLCMVSPMGDGYSAVIRGDQVFTTDMAGEEVQPNLFVGKVAEVKAGVDGTPVYVLETDENGRLQKAFGRLDFLMIAIPSIR